MELKQDKSESVILEDWLTNLKNIPKLPKLIGIDLTKIPDETFDYNEYNNFTFEFKNEMMRDSFKIPFYVPFLRDKENPQENNIKETVSKISRYRNKNISRYKNTNKEFEVVTVYSSRPIYSCLNAAYNVNAIANYLKNIDNVCSSCDRYNRSWECCGRFAPYMYMYFYLLIEKNFDAYKLKHGFTIGSKQYQIYQIATVFYKVITGYAHYDERYSDLISDLDVNHGVSIPTHNDSPDFWYLPEDFYNNKTFENNKSYMVNVCRNFETSHHFFIFRCEKYIIVCDSWANKNSTRGPITRIFELDSFLYCINFINHVYFNMDNFDSDEKKSYNKKYNIIMDALFLIPYTANQIKGNAFSFPKKGLHQIKVIDRNRINGVFSGISSNNNIIFNKYLHFGGKKRNKSVKRKIIKNNKSYSKRKA
jgi:hypothetical protein